MPAVTVAAGQAGALPVLACTLAASALPRFTGLLQRGVVMPLRGEVSVAAFLTEELRLDPRYVAERITTVFLDGQVVDRLEGAVLRGGGLLALSAAMPGLVGATLRRGGYYAAMREGITHRPGARPSPPRGGELVRVKLFNLLLAELGPVLLARGIVLGRDEAAALLAGLVDRADVPAGEPLLLRVGLGHAPR